jgi:hypothetical protein
MTTSYRKAPSSESGWKKSPPIDGPFRFNTKISNPKSLSQLRAELEEAILEAQHGDPNPATFNSLYEAIVQTAICFNPPRIQHDEAFAYALHVRAMMLNTKYADQFTAPTHHAALSFTDIVNNLQKKYADPSELAYFPKQFSAIDFTHLLRAVGKISLSIGNAASKTDSTKPPTAIPSPVKSPMK